MHAGFFFLEKLGQNHTLYSCHHPQAPVTQNNTEMLHSIITTAISRLKASPSKMNESMRCDNIQTICKRRKFSFLIQ